jgi:drug/metabolite transporter (DMT)-like permease
LPPRCLNIAVRHIGPRATSVFLSSVPVVAALTAIPILNELPGLPAWIGMIAVTLGILLALGIIGFHQETAAAGK